jgi:hypothetical protein
MNAKVNRFERILKTKVKVRDDERILLSMEKKEEERLLSVLATLGTERNKPSPPSVPRRTKPSPCRISGSDEKPSTTWTAVSAGRGNPSAG